jgi:hypothetical protein
MHMRYTLNTNGCSYVIEKGSPSRDGVGPGSCLLKSMVKLNCDISFHGLPIAALCLRRLTSPMNYRPISAKQHVQPITPFDWRRV